MKGWRSSGGSGSDSREANRVAFERQSGEAVDLAPSRLELTSGQMSALKMICTMTGEKNLSQALGEILHEKRRALLDERRRVL